MDPVLDQIHEEREIVWTESTFDVILSYVFYMFTIHVCSTKVDFDVETFDHTRFRVIQYWIK